MDIFQRVPPELWLLVLEHIQSLHDLQSAIIASRTLYEAYSAYRQDTRYQVFLNQCIVNQAGPIKSEDIYIFHSEVAKLEPTLEDGLYYHSKLWPITMRHSTQFLSHMFSLQYVVDALRGRKVDLACRIYDEGLTIPANTEERVYKGIWIDLLNDVLMDRPFQLGKDLLPQAEFWLHVLDKFLVLPPDKCTLSKQVAIPESFHQSSPQLPDSVMQEMVERSWKLITHTFLTGLDSIDGVVDFTCMILAIRGLTKSQRRSCPSRQVSLQKMTDIWHALPKRTNESECLGQDLIKFYTESTDDGSGHLTALNILWAGHRADPTTDTALFERYDLELARDIILKLKNLNDVPAALAFQHEVLTLLGPDSDSYIAFARNLCDAYIRENEVESALRVLEEVWPSLSPGSKMWRMWGVRLGDVYCQLGQPWMAQEVRAQVDPSKKG